MQKKHKILIASLAGFLGLFLLSFFFLQFINNNKIARGLSLAGFDLGGKKLAEAQTLLDKKIADFQKEEFTLSYQGKNWNATPEDLGIKIKNDDSFLKLSSYGHGTSLLASVGEQIESLFFKKDLDISYSVDQKKMDLTLQKLSDIETPPQDAKIKYNAETNSFEVLTSQDGILIGRSALAENIIDSFSSQNRTVDIALVPTKAQVDESEASSLLSKIEEITQKAPYYLEGPDNSWKVEKQEVATWLQAGKSDGGQPEIILDKKEVSDFLSPIAVAINRKPVDARLDWKNGEIKFALLAQEGKELDIEMSAENIKEGLLAGQQKISLVINSIQPQISNASIEGLGLTTLLGKGESNFAGSPKNRQHNISVGASKLNGFLIRPGEEFSFGKSIGEIDAQNGWLPELVIKGNKTIPEYGGGLCQISTTLFRAALNSGLKVTERHPHAYAVHYYNPAGFDATVYPPSPDLKFINDTTSHILLQTRIEGTKLFFEIYGTPDGRETKIIGPKILSSNPDGSMKTLLKQQVWKDGKMLHEDSFYSNYKSPSLYPVVTPSPSVSPSVSPSASPSPSTSASPSASPSA